MRTRDRVTETAPVLNAPIGAGATRVVATPPPSAHAEVVPARSTNEAGQAWVPGHYVLNGAEWTWIHGSWQRPPSPGATWVPAQYNAQNKRWTEGYWATTGGTSKR